MIVRDPLPNRVRVLILGGGIHGVGVLHDMASRGWTDIHLIEKATLGVGTSSRSTKLIHGGLRYLKRITDFGLVSEALHERRLLMQLLPDLVKPVEFLFPILKSGGMPRFMVKTGLSLYDFLAGQSGIPRHKALTEITLNDKAPILNQELFSRIYSFWDAQTDDLALVKRAAACARTLGAGISEKTEAISIQPSEHGWDVEIRKEDQSIHRISALYVINALGPWANRLLEQSRITPTHKAINNKGIHLLFPDLGLKAGLFLQSVADRRIFFVLPWQGYTLVGTTEDLYSGHPDELNVKDAEIRYLLDNCNRFLKIPLKQENLVSVFAGLRWLAVEAGHGISDTSRAYVIGERAHKRGLLMTLYGGKYTTYRNLSQSIGNRITKHFGEFRESTTHDPKSWVVRSDLDIPTEAIATRFQNPPG